MVINRIDNESGKGKEPGIESQTSGVENTKNQFEIFDYKNLGSMRIIVDETGKWFCLKDVCNILEIKEPQRITERGRRSMTVITKGGPQQAIFLNEGNLFRLITGSRKKEARAFTDWVCDVVLPALNRKGRYRIGEENEPKQPWSPVDGLRHLVDFMESFNSRIEDMSREMSDLKEVFNKVHNNDMTKNEFYTVSGFAKCHDISINFKQSGELGKKAIKYCNNNGLSVSRKPVSPDTFINSYPYDALKAVFEDYFDINL